MEKKQSFRDNIINGYTCKGDFIVRKLITTEKC